METKLEFAVNGRILNINGKADQLQAMTTLTYLCCATNPLPCVRNIGKSLDKYLNHCDRLSMKIESLRSFVDQRISKVAAQSIYEDIHQLRKIYKSAADVEQSNETDNTGIFMTIKYSIYGLLDYLADIETLLESAVLPVRNI